jgi:hypothetical protein
MQAQQAPIQQQSHVHNPAALPCFESSFAEHTSRAAAVYSDEVPLLAARLSAMRDADKFCLPMTVYRSENSYGWAYTNPLAPFLKKSEVFVTILPARFFQ